jgi:hypothetical protein
MRAKLVRVAGRVGRWLASFESVPVASYWVGVTRYEGNDEAAAAAAYIALRDETVRIPGDVELMRAADRLRFFKVV